MPKKPQENHRVILNAIREVRNLNIRGTSSQNMIRANGIIDGMEYVIKRMTVGKEHRRILREWHRLARAHYSNTSGYDAALSIEAQMEKK